MDLKEIFYKINFVELYSQLSQKYSDNNGYMESVDLNQVQVIFEELGYKPKLFKKEKFFRFSTEISSYVIWFHICLKYGQAELMLYVKDGQSFLKPNGPFSWIPEQLDIHLDKRISMPVFKNYDDLKGILVESIYIYEKFITEMTHQLTNKRLI